MQLVMLLLLLLLLLLSHGTALTACLFCDEECLDFD
jgi:hypothetical protein